MGLIKVECTLPGTDAKARPLTQPEWALRMLGWLTFCPDLRTVIQAEYERHAAAFLNLTQKQKAAAAAATAAAAAAAAKAAAAKEAENAEDAPAAEEGAKDNAE